MPITTGDIRLVKSQVMTDADNGGGAATGTAVIDGQSNNIFPDTSELDHVVGRVQLRKVFIQINTADTDTYLGANAIISKPPGNPEISGVLFSTEDDFDTRDAAATRIESYLAAGPSYPGYLFGDHIAGQMTVSVQQRVGVALPSNGDTLVLSKFPGTTSEFDQFIRVTDVSSTNRDFTTADGGGTTFTRTIVSLTISAALEEDFPGFDAIYNDGDVSYTGKTEILGSVVADAARYYGIVPLTAAALFGDFGVLGDGIYSQLVPSSRTEIAIPDARMNQSTPALAGTGVTANFSENVVFDHATPVFVGGGITPRSLTVTSGGASISDKGGTLIDALGNVVGAVDYGSGTLTLASDVFGTSTATKTFTYLRAAPSTTINESMGLEVTPVTRRLTWVVTLDPIPAPGTLEVSYLSQGHWYTLNDDGSGALRGSDSSFGVGVMNPTTGTVSITLGALPDAPSQIILSWANGAAPAVVGTIQTGSVSAAVIPISSGLTHISVGGLSITWGGHTVTDNASAPGTLQGYGTGSVNYDTGDIVLCPTQLPAPGTVLTVTATNLATSASGVISAFTSSGSTYTANIGAGPLAGSVAMSIYGSYPLAQPNLHDSTVISAYDLYDDGAGHLQIRSRQLDGTFSLFTIGTVNYTTGDVVLNKTVSITMGQPEYQTTTVDAQPVIVFKDNHNRTITWSMLNGDGGATKAASYSYHVASAPGSTISYTVASVQVQANLPQVQTGNFDPTLGAYHGGVTLYGALAPGATFNLAGASYITLADGTVQKNPAPGTGIGTAAGSWISSTGIITVTDWAAAVAPVITLFSAVSSPATAVGSSVLSTAVVVFRTATSPLASAGFSVRGTMADGTTFNVNADTGGVISDTEVHGRVDYNTGIVELVFGTVNAGPASATIRDITDLSIPGVSFIALSGANMASLVYDAVAFSYLPLDPAILGLDPVRLPSDGRVPIFKKGGVAVVHYTKTIAAATYANGDTLDLTQLRISAVEGIDNTGAPLTGGYTVNMDTGIVTIVSTAGWSQPITFNSRIEDMALITDAQISGQISLSRALSHAYPLGSYVSSAFLIGDMQSAVGAMFAQQTWTNVWQDTPIGTPILAAYDQIDHPPEVTNAATETENWALIFTNSTSFTIVGEHLGTIGVGNTSSDCAPLNPNTSTPYFLLHKEGFGTGWAAGNVIRINTVGSHEPIWLARVVQQGDNVSTEDNFALLIRGDVNT